MTTRKRLEFSVRMLDRIDAQRQSKHDRAVFAAIEARIVRRELDELEAEWRVNSEVSGESTFAWLKAHATRPFPSRRSWSSSPLRLIRYET